MLTEKGGEIAVSWSSDINGNSYNQCYCHGLHNKQARKSSEDTPGTLGLKKFGPGKLWVKKVWA